MSSGEVYKGEAVEDRVDLRPKTEDQDNLDKLLADAEIIAAADGLPPAHLKDPEDKPEKKV